METEFSQEILDELLQGSGEGSNLFEKKADEITSSMEFARYDKYAKVIAHLKALKAEDKITQAVFAKTFKQVLKVSQEEFGYPLTALELEKSMEFIKEYEEQRKTLKALGILQDLPESGQQGLIGLNGLEYTLPTIAEISEKLSIEDIELLKLKQKQGFNKLIIVPFALVLRKIVEIYERELDLKQTKGELKSPSGDQIHLGEFGLFNIDDAYNEADLKRNGLIYFPSKLEKSGHGGISKSRLLFNEPSEGWRICLVEDFVNVPGYGEGKSVGGREQPEYLSSSDYLSLIQSGPHYNGERAFTIEDWIWLALTRLKNDNILIDQGSTDCVNAGSVFSGKNGITLSTCTSITEKFPSNLSAWHSSGGVGGLGFRSTVKIN